MESFEFIDQVVDHIKRRRIFDLVLQGIEQDKRTWDKAARERIGPVVKDVFQKSFPEIEVKEAQTLFSGSFGALATIALSVTVCSFPILLPSLLSKFSSYWQNAKLPDSFLC
jgi:hypothetical protein